MEKSQSCMYKSLYKSSDKFLQSKPLFANHITDDYKPIIFDAEAIIQTLGQRY